MSRTESLPETWDDVRDLAFFSITASVFPPAFTYGAGVLLASYDDEQVTPAPALPPIRVPAAHRPHPAHSR